MKKLTCVLLACFLVLNLGACGARRDVSPEQAQQLEITQSPTEKQKEPEQTQNAAPQDTVPDQKPEQEELPSEPEEKPEDPEQEPQEQEPQEPEPEPEVPEDEGWSCCWSMRTIRCQRISLSV